MLPILSLVFFLISLIGFAVLLVLNTTSTGIITVISLMILTFYLYIEALQMVMR